MTDSRFRKKIFPELAKKVNEKQEAIIEELDDWSVSIDEAKDCSRTSYYAVMLLNAIVPREVYLGNALVERGNSDNIREGVKGLKIN